MERVHIGPKLHHYFRNKFLKLPHTCVKLMYSLVPTILQKIMQAWHAFSDYMESSFFSVNLKREIGQSHSKLQIRMIRSKPTMIIEK